ncbi:hypothetical protein MKW92_029549 [Papaver armeniacum]|nr:hypothetical protein MKW92_029549 [Papaver armeniacum]
MKTRTPRASVKRRLLGYWKMMIGIICMWAVLVLAANVVTNIVEMCHGICCRSRLQIPLKL